MLSELIKATILGLVEGLTEFLPISSTGHLILVSKAIAFEGAKAETFEVFIQLGAILAVVVLYFARFVKLLNFRDNSEFSGFAGIGKLIVTCVPAAALGLKYHKAIKEYLFHPVPVATALIVGGLLILLLERKPPPVRVDSVEKIGYLKALQIGMVQCLALWPGMSRSGSMIIGGMFFGLSRSVAAEFSFLVAVPLIAMAALYDLLKSLEFLSATDIPTFAVGFVVSFVSAMMAIKFFISKLQAGTMTPYAIYRIGLGILVLLLN